MNLQQNKDHPFLQKIIRIIKDNLDNDQFGVSMLARESGMSRSNLHRKVNKLTGRSVSRLISETRLEAAIKMLREPGTTVSEVAFKVGFGSATYFTKCFHEYYGYPPGDIVKSGSEGDFTPGSLTGSSSRVRHKGKFPLQWMLAGALIALATILLIFFRPASGKALPEDLVIAVLPFHNDSPDREYDYILNGLLEEILNKLAHVDELSVISRTTSESYRDSDKSIREIGREIQARYILEGSATILDNKTRIRLQLIEAETDSHLWSKPFEREITMENLFEVQEEVALAITTELRVLLDPAEKKQVETTPSENREAYKFFLQAQELINFASLEGADAHDHRFLKARQLLGSALQLDSSFAAAHTWLGHLYIDFFFFAEIYRGADVAKACMDSGLLYLDHALSLYEANPGPAKPRDGNYYFTLRTKANYLKRQGHHISADSVFQEAMKGYDADSYLKYYASLDWHISYNDYYTTISDYLHYMDKKPAEIIVPSWIHRIMYHAYYSAGFFKLAREHSFKLLSLDRNSSEHYRRMHDLEMASGNYAEGIQWALKLYRSAPLDPNNFTGLIWNYLCMGEFEQAERITREVMEGLTREGSDQYRNATIAYVLMRQGDKEKALQLLRSELDRATGFEESNTGVRRSGNLYLYIARIYSILGEKQKTLEYLSKLNDVPVIHARFIRELKDWPSYESVRKTSEFQEILGDIQARHMMEHKKISGLLREFVMIEH